MVLLYTVLATQGDRERRKGEKEIKMRSRKEKKEKRIKCKHYKKETKL
jgi:hypothetical protein